MQQTVSLKISTPSERELTMTRVFDAPRGMVFDCWTKPELLKRWLFGPNGWVFAVCEIDLRVGGKYRFVWHKDPNIEMGMGGVYREVVFPERIVNTQLFDEDWTAGEVIGTLVFSENPGKTTVTYTLKYSSRTARDGAMKSGMEQGMATGYDRLDAILRTMSTRGTS